MSGRAVRKALRQREAELLQAQTPEQEVEESDNESVAAAPPKPSLFALLNIADERDEQDEDEGDEVAEPESKLKPEPSRPVTSAKKSKKKKKTKGKAKAKKEEVVEEDDGEDEIERALRQLNIVPANTSTLAAGDPDKSPAETPLSAALKVDSRNLDAENEMKKLFGRSALRPADTGEAAVAPGGRRRGRMQMLPGPAGGRALAKGRKNTFVQPKEEWPNASSGGLGMEIEDSDMNTGVTTYKFVHSRQYQGVQREFMMCVASMGMLLLALLRTCYNY
jgi:hypothetical protein